jgi:L-alanine-DL-glutamate epimerase-like enolase superfamily enzyme
LTEALKLLKIAREQSFDIMVGCMVGSSLAIAPATLLTHFADFVDLDAPAFLVKDKAFGFTYNNGQMSPLEGQLWGGAS